VTEYKLRGIKQSNDELQKYVKIKYYHEINLIGIEV
jgi:hypothetical protein